MLRRPVFVILGVLELGVSVTLIVLALTLPTSDDVHRATDRTGKQVRLFRQQVHDLRRPEQIEGRADPQVAPRLRRMLHRWVERPRKEECEPCPAQRAFDDLVSAEQTAADPQRLVALADEFLHAFAGTPPEAKVRRLREAHLRRLEERVLEAARAHSARYPFDFAARRKHYQRYLDKHPDGLFVREAGAALVVAGGLLVLGAPGAEEPVVPVEAAGTGTSREVATDVPG